VLAVCEELFPDFPLDVDLEAATEIAVGVLVNCEVSITGVFDLGRSA
jgi:hypothetical protein